MSSYICYYCEKPVESMARCPHCGSVRTGLASIYNGLKEIANKGGNSALSIGKKKEFHVLNLGAGVQSTTLYLLACEPGSGYTFDVAIMGDTGSEPKAVYRHVEWLKSLKGPPIFIHSMGNLKTDLIEGRHSTGQRFVSIPAFVAPPEELREPSFDPIKEAGRSKRQCTREYKIDAVEWVIRRRLIGLRYRQRMPKNVLIHQHFGISTDEMRRQKRIQERFDKDKSSWARCRFPLIEKGLSRKDCIAYLKTAVPHPVPKSACTFCPYQDDYSWAEMKRDDPESFREACETDRAIRSDGAMCTERLDNALYLHRSCIPLDMVDLSNPKPPTLDLFSVEECEGMCGN